MAKKYYELTLCPCYEGVEDSITFNTCKLTGKSCSRSECKIKTAIKNYHDKGVYSQNVGLFIDTGFKIITEQNEEESTQSTHQQMNQQIQEIILYYTQLLIHLLILRRELNKEEIYYIKQVQKSILKEIKSQKQLKNILKCSESKTK